MEIRFLGAAREVTGSCFHLISSGTQVLVDCGMRQGVKKNNHSGDSAFSFNPAEIDCVLLTHAHIDHSGLLPRLVKEGFRGKIFTTPATADLIKVMLLDSANIQEKDAEWMTKKSFRAGRDENFYPLYNVSDVEMTLPLISEIAYGVQEKPGADMSFTFTDAGHILGSGSVDLRYAAGAKNIIFSGDIGKPDNPIIADPVHSKTADYVVIESTYGNRMHKNMEESVNELVDAINSTFKKGGNVIIPTFAIGRTQDLLYIFNNLVRSGRLGKIDVYVDSPLAEEATKIYLAHPEVYDEEARKLFGQKGAMALKLHFVESIEQSQRLNRIRSGAIIMAGSGMCEGGRIRHHFKHNIWRPECSIVFVGFQANGTLGRKIVDGADKVNVLGEDMAVRAKIYTIGGFSAHGDQKDLLGWLGAFKNHPEVFIVHGEETAALDFEQAVKEKFGFTTHVPTQGESFQI
ncbi:MAG: MBL fold metallo-hydrolase [Syntrophaceae bacterium]